MSESAPQGVSPTPKPHFVRSLVALILGSLVLRAASGAMGENIQFYLNAIHEAAINPNHPLRNLVGGGNVYEVSYTLGGIIIATFFASELIGAMVLGAWSDRFGRKVFIIFGSLFGAVAVQITALTTALWILVVTRLMEGLSTASNVPATLGLIADETSHSSKLRTRVASFYEVATIGGIALGFSLGGWMWRQFGSAAVVLGVPLTSPAFALNAVIYVASFLIFWLGIHEVREQRKKGAAVHSIGQELKHYWKVASSPRVAGFAPAWVAINAVLGIWINLTARILTDPTGRPGQVLVGTFDSLQAGNIRAVYAIFFVLGILVWGLVFPQVNKIKAMLIGTAGLFVSDIFLFAINHQPSLSAPLVLPLGVLLVVSIMVQSGFTPAALAHLADITEEHSGDRGAIMGLYSVFMGLGQLVGTTLGGPFIDWLGADGMVLSTMLLGLFSGFLLLRLRVFERQFAGQTGAGDPPLLIESAQIEPGAAE